MCELGGARPGVRAEVPPGLKGPPVLDSGTGTYPHHYSMNLPGFLGVGVGD